MQAARGQLPIGGVEAAAGDEESVADLKDELPPLEGATETRE